MGAPTLFIRGNNNKSETNFLNIAVNYFKSDSTIDTLLLHAHTVQYTKKVKNKTNQIVLLNDQDNTKKTND